MAFAFIQVPPQSTGLKVDTAELTNGANTVERQVAVIGDPLTAGSVANVTPSGQLTVTTASQKASYSAAVAALNAGTSATTELFTLYGSASKTIRIQKIVVSATQTTAAAIFDVCVFKRSTAASGGTPGTVPTVVPLDSGFAAGSAVPAVYTAAPTAGTNVGLVSVAKVPAAITATGSTFTPVAVFDSGVNGAEIVLRGTVQGVAVTLNGATPAQANSFNISVLWTEE